MRRHILLYEGKCGRCSKLATEVVAVSEQRLDAVRLDDPLAAQWAEEAGKPLPLRPALVVLSSQKTRLLTGVSMIATLVRHLGARQSATVLRAIGDDRGNVSEKRRAFLRTGVAGLAVVTGSILLPGTALAGTTPELTAEEKRDLLAQAAGYDRMDVVRQRLLRAGFELMPQEEIVVGTVADAAVLSFYARKDGDPTRAAVLVRRVARGRVDASLEYVSGDPKALASGGRINTAALQVSPLSLARPGEAEPLSPNDYFRCMFACIGANCSDRAQNCIRLPTLALALACLLVVCGSETRPCHGVCKSEW
ncbi:hypothetical protein ACFWYW_38140 [Nonomuraea sp. NPDC059023]|uniref:hypothetical protein n=1 Tax=unclassified Nonomuraea TaxID=2593643 RepID=UPI0036838120